MSQFVGEGTSGCVHRPALKCAQDRDIAGKSVEYDNTVSKLAEPHVLHSEIRHFDQIEQIDPRHEFHTGKPVLCHPQKNVEFQRALLQCKQKDYRSRQVDLMIMSDAGSDLKTFVNHLSNQKAEEARQQVIEFWTEMMRIVEGLRVLLRKGAIHYDLKEDNITYDFRGRRANLIDFGNLYGKNKIVQDALQSVCTRCIEHWSWPPENQYLNHDSFHDVYQKENEHLYWVILQVLFSPGLDPDEEYRVLKSIATSNRQTLLEKKNRVDEIPLNRRSALSALFEEMKTPLFPHLLRDYLNDLHNLFRQHAEWTYTDFVEKSLNTVDVYGLGIAWLYALKHTRPYMSDVFFGDLYSLSCRMVTPDLKKRITVDILLREYKAVLKKHVVGFVAPKIRVPPGPSRMWAPHSITEKPCSEGKMQNPRTGRCIKIENLLRQQQQPGSKTSRRHTSTSSMMQVSQRKTRRITPRL